MNIQKAGGISPAIIRTYLRVLGSNKTTALFLPLDKDYLQIFVVDNSKKKMIMCSNDELLDGYQGIWSECRNRVRETLEFHFFNENFVQEVNVMF